MKKDLDKQSLYEGVKQLVECENQLIHLPQPKLFTLFSLAFQYMLYRSQSEKGHYIIRVEDNYLMDKLCRKSKDQSTRAFMQKLNLPRKLTFQGSCFHLDFFSIPTWNNTKDLPQDKIKGALVVKNTSSHPLGGAHLSDESDEELIAMAQSDSYLSLLSEFVPKVIFISYQEEPELYRENLENFQQIRFPFLPDEGQEKKVKGVKIYEPGDWD